ncbi:MAG: hypothetical protein H8D67_24360 [Deltaproteobacteria bacterium]|nr:hypothetical protein [Deltaproteobacteria bacterium]
MNRNNNLTCPNHPEIHPTKYRVTFRGIYRRFNNYTEALRFLTGLRYKVDEGSFDRRDYEEKQPLGFKNLTQQYLEIKRYQVKFNTWRKLADHLKKACDIWENKNIKHVLYGDIELFITGLKLSSKTKHNHLTSLKQFFRWAEKAYRIPQPDFPEISFELGWRKTISKDLQQEIIQEVYQISKPVNVKIWLGIKWLSTYFNCRPGEILDIKEGDIDLSNGEILIRHTKEKKTKVIYLLPDDVAILKSFPTSLPHLYFFRHRPGIKGIKAGNKFGIHLFYTYWKKACDNLDVKGVDLYGGTRHSSVRALRGSYTPEQIKLASMHSTNKAFERYFQVDGEYLRDIYAGKELAKNSEGKKTAKLLKLQG